MFITFLMDNYCDKNGFMGELGFSVHVGRAASLAFPGIPLRAVVGGFHFSEADEAGMKLTARALAALGPEKVLCSHCTGVKGYAALAATLPGKVSWLACGASATI